MVVNIKLVITYISCTLKKQLVQCQVITHGFCPVLTFKMSEILQICQEATNFVKIQLNLWQVKRQINSCTFIKCHLSSKEKKSKLLFYKGYEYFSLYYYKEGISV